MHVDEHNEWLVHVHFRIVDYGVLCKLVTERFVSGWTLPADIIIQPLFDDSGNTCQKKQC